MENKLLVTPSPHLQGDDTTRGIMLDVVIALFPAIIASGIFFGVKSIITIVVCVVSCVVFEFISRKVMKRDQTIGDLSAVVTGILLAFNLPATISPIYAIIGSAVAIIVVKQMFGGIGNNFVNPALTARIVLMVSFPVAMSNWVEPFFYRTVNGDAVTTATPLPLITAGEDVGLPSLIDMFIGNTAGCLGETSALALLLGGIYLVVRHVISPTIPCIFIGTVALGSWIFGSDPLYSILGGGVMLGAIFMATDYTTSPLTKWGKVIFAFGCGALTVLIREFAALPEGVSYSIIIMNILTPLIERFTMPKPFGKESAK